MPIHKPRVVVRKARGRPGFVKDFISGKGVVFRDVTSQKGAPHGVVVSRFKVCSQNGTGVEPSRAPPSRRDVISQLDRAFSSWKGTKGAGIFPIR